MPALGVLLLVFGVFFMYTGGKSLRPIRMLQAFFQDPANIGTTFQKATAAAKATAYVPPVSDGLLDTATSHDGATVVSGQNPWAGLKVTAPYGQVQHSGTFGVPHTHQGIDYAMPSGTALPAVIAGTMKVVQGSGEAGWQAEVIGDGIYTGWTTLYDHVKHFLAGDGNPVKVGQSIADSGGAANDPGKGDATGPHLHFEVHHLGAVVNPDKLWAWEAANLSQVKDAQTKAKQSPMRTQ